MKKIFFVLLLISLITSSVTVACGAENGISYLAISEENSQVLLSNGPSETVDGAFLYKMMLALIAFENSDDSNITNIARACIILCQSKYAFQLESELKKVGIDRDGLIKYYIALLSMNDTYINTSGLVYDDLGETTVNDICIFLTYALKNKKFLNAFESCVYVDEGIPNISWFHSVLPEDEVNGCDVNGWTWHEYGVDNVIGALRFTYVPSGGDGEMNVLMVIAGAAKENLTEIIYEINGQIQEKYTVRNIVEAGVPLMSVSADGVSLNLVSTEDVKCVVPLNNISFVKNVSYIFNQGFSANEISLPVYRGENICIANYILLDETTFDVVLVADRTVLIEDTQGSHGSGPMPSIIILSILLACGGALLLIRVFIHIKGGKK